jgi:hypothetical protein
MKQDPNRKARKPRLICLSAYARRIGVTPQAITRLIGSGQIKVVQTKGRKKFIDSAQADEARRRSRLRFRINQQASQAFLAAYTRKLELQTEISALRLARARGDVLDRAASVERVEGLGRSIRRRLDTLPDHADELVDIFQARGKKAMAELWVKRVREARMDIEAILGTDRAG